MEAPDRVEINIQPIKIVILGNRGVGKSALDLQWFQRKYIERSNPSSALEFCPVQKYVKFSLSEIIKSITLQIWEASEVNDSQHESYPFLQDARLFIIVVDASDNEVEQMSQINKWYSFIRDRLTTLNESNLEIIVVQNKIDLPHINLLNKDAIRDIFSNLKDLIVTSCKNRQNISLLDTHLVRIAQNLFNQQSSIASTIQLFSQKESFDQVSEAINMLTDEQANHLLNYLDIILKMGTRKNVNKPYQLFIFGGGENYTYDNEDNAIMGADSRINGTFPKHIIPILTAIQERKKSAKELLNYIYLEALSISEDEPFIRRHSTHLFYTVVIPGYLKKVTNEISHSINDAIMRLTCAQAIIIINNFKIKLLAGPGQNIEKPYNIKVGGERYLHQRMLITVPHHVFWMIQKIDNFLEKLNINTYMEPMLSKSKRILFELYHDTLIAGLTFNSERDTGTQDFYANVLQDFIINELSIFDSYFARLSNYRSPSII